MAEQTTFVKIDRNILQWRWYQDSNTMRVFLHLILMANIKDHDFEKITVHRGELVTSLTSLSKQLKMSIRSVRTSLEHLKSTGEVTSRNYPHYQVISISEYDRYQAIPTRQTTRDRHGIDTASTRDRQQSKNSKKDKNEKNGKNVLPTPQPSDAVAYFAEHGRSEADAMKFFRYNQARGWKINRTPIDDWKAAADIWFDEAPDVGGGSDNAELDAFGKPIQKEFV